MKAELREASRQRRLSRHRADLVSVSRSIHERLESFSHFADASTVLFYVSKDDEIQTHELIKQALTSKRVLVPRLNDEKRIVICEIDSFDDLLPGAFDVLEPKGCKERSMKEVDVVIVPGLLFDRKGYRIGYGLGYYDRLLEKFDGTTVGLCADEDLMDEVPHDTHDIPVWYIMTEAGLTTVKEKT